MKPEDIQAPQDPSAQPQPVVAPPEVAPVPAPIDPQPLTVQSPPMLATANPLSIEAKPKSKIPRILLIVLGIIGFVLVGLFVLGMFLGRATDLGPLTSKSFAEDKQYAYSHLVFEDSTTTESGVPVTTGSEYAALTSSENEKEKLTSITYVVVENIAKIKSSSPAYSDLSVDKLYEGYKTATGKTTLENIIALNLNAKDVNIDGDLTGWTNSYFSNGIQGDFTGKSSEGARLKGKIVFTGNEGDYVYTFITVSTENVWNSHTGKFTQIIGSFKLDR